MKGLTKRQREIADFIHQFIDVNRYSPSYREIMSHFGYSCIGSVAKHLTALKRKGVVTSEKRCGRSLSVESSIAKPKSDVEISLIGEIQAGEVIHMYSQPRNLPAPSFLIPQEGSYYFLKVIGDGFEEELIGNGDLLLIEARQEAHPGETVIATINNHETIIKKYELEGVYIKLTSKRQPPIIIKEEYLTIQAILIAVMRTMFDRSDN